MNNLEKGKAGENLAKLHYEMLGYEFLEANYRYRRSEIDLIFLKDEKLMVFIEVKRRSSNQYGEPEAFVSVQQIDRIKLAAEAYIFAINWSKEVRFDVVSINESNEVEVFEDAF